MWVGSRKNSKDKQMNFYYSWKLQCRTIGDRQTNLAVRKSARTAESNTATKQNSVSNIYKEI